MLFWLLIIITSIIFCFPVTFIRKYIETSNINWIFGSLIVYACIIYLYYQILKINNNISYIYSFLNIISILLVTLISIFYFNDTINFNQVLGIFFAIIAIIFFQKK